MCAIWESVCNMAMYAICVLVSATRAVNEPNKHEWKFVLVRLTYTIKERSQTFKCINFYVRLRLLRNLVCSYLFMFICLVDKQT